VSNRSANDIFAARLHAMTGAAAPVADELRSHPAQPDEFISRFFSGGGERSAGVVVNETTAMSVSAVFACVRNLAEDEAKLPFLTYEKLEPRGKQRRTDVPVYRLLHDSPNPEMTAFDFRQAMTASAALFGGGLAEIERTNDGAALALWPIEPWRWRVERVGPKGRDLIYRIDGRDILSPRDVLHIKGFGINGIVGYMLAQVGKESLGLTLAAQRFAANFYANGTRFTGLISHPKVMSPEAYKRLEESFNSNHAGVDRAHGTKVLEEGVTWTKTSADANEAQMLEARQFQVEDVARWLRMPPHKIGHLERAQGWSTLESANTDYVIDTLMPWLVRWEQECQRKLIGTSDTNLFCEHLVNGMMRGDSAARSAYYKAMREIGVYNADDIRELENENPLPGDQGQIYLVPLNMQDMSKINEPPPAPPELKPPVAAPSAPPVPESRSLLVQPDPNAIRQAHQPAFLDAATRVVRREVEVLRKKAKSADAVEQFFRDHATYARSVFGPAINAYEGCMAVMGGRVPESVSATVDFAPYVRELSAAVADGTVVEVLDRWEREKPAELVRDHLNITIERPTP
jgi:HK97 family phage portal protein